MASPWVYCDCAYRSRMAMPWVYLVPGFGIRIRFCVGAFLRVRPVFSVPRQGIHNLDPGNAGGIRCGVCNCGPNMTHSVAMGYFNAALPGLLGIRF